MEQTAGEGETGEDNQGWHQLCPKQGTACMGLAVGRMGAPRTCHVGYKPHLKPWAGWG